MNFGDVFKKSFLASFNTGDITMGSILLTLLITCLFAAYIFVIYRVVTRKTFYSKSFNTALAIITVIVSAIIITIQSSLVVSLGMVGALSIVRFRTAIKDPMDLVFLFWSISVGIICGAGLPGIAAIASAIITAGILILEAVPVAKAPLLLVVSAGDKSARSAILEAVKAHTGSYHVKTQTMESSRLDMIIEVRTKDGEGLIDSVAALPNIRRCSLLSHDGEVTF